MTKSPAVLAAALVSVVACLPEPQPPRNWVPDAFAREIPSCQQQYKQSEDSVDTEESTFQGWLEGATPGMAQSSEYKSMMGVHKRTVTRIAEIKQGFADLMTWADKTRPIATQDDYTRLLNECGQLGRQMANAGTYYFQVSTQQMTLSSKYPR